MSRAKRSAEEPTESTPMSLRLAWLLLAGAWCFTAASLFSFTPLDPPNLSAAPLNAVPANWCGRIGAMLSYKLFFLFGVGTWLLLAATGWLLSLPLRKRSLDQPFLRGTGLVILTVSVAGLAALWGGDGPVAEVGPGGLLAAYLTGKMNGLFSGLGTGLIFGVMLLIGSMLAADHLVLGTGRLALSLTKQVAGGLMHCGQILVWLRDALLAPLRWLSFRPRFESERAIPVRHNGRASGDEEAEVEVRAASSSRRVKIEEEAEEIEEDEPAEEETAPRARCGAKKAKAEPQAEEEDEADEEPEAPRKAEKAEKTALDPEALRAKIKKLPISFASARKPSAPPRPPQQDLSGYKFPPMDMLLEPESSFGEEMAQIVRDQAEILERALQTYRIEAEVVGIDAGPVITLYEVQLAPGTKVNQLNAIASDLARELKAQNIRIVSNTAGKSTVGIEVPNLKKEKVRLKELMALGGEEAARMALPMYLGKDASGNPLIADLAKMPHMLIAGTTGSGKSVCMNSIIMSFLYTRRPDELKLVLVDPKMVEMAQFRDIPHLMCPVVTEMNRAAAILEWAVTQMEERYALLAEAGCRDIDGYNGMTWDDLKDRFNPKTPEEEAKIPKKLARMVFVIDELADLMMTNKEVEGFIVRIAQKARAVGIHLILATQRPQANVVTGLIKSNMPCRVSFKVSSGMDSRIVLDAKGAELLLGQGDMLYLSPRTSKLSRAQGTLVDDSEVRSVVKFLKTIATQCFEPQLIQLKTASVAEGEEGGESGDRDPLFEDAVRIVLESRRGSVSLLQRRMAIGYSRASRLVEQMAEAGILGDYKGSQAREVNFTIEEWEAMKAQASADAEMEEAVDTVEIAEARVSESEPESGPEAEEAEEESAEEEANSGGSDEAEDDEEYEEYEYVDEEEERVK